MNEMNDYEWMMIEGILDHINRRLLKKHHYISVQWDEDDECWFVFKGKEAWNDCFSPTELYDYLAAMKDGIQIALEGRE